MKYSVSVCAELLDCSSILYNVVAEGMVTELYKQAENILVFVKLNLFVEDKKAQPNL